MIFVLRTFVFQASNNYVVDSLSARLLLLSLNQSYRANNTNVSLATIIIMLTYTRTITMMWISIMIIVGWRFHYFEPGHKHDLVIKNNDVGGKKKNK